MLFFACNSVSLVTRPKTRAQPMFRGTDFDLDLVSEPIAITLQIRRFHQEWVLFEEDTETLIHIVAFAYSTLSFSVNSNVVISTVMFSDGEEPY